MTKKKIGVLGSGAVGETLANGFLAEGHAVMRGSREPSKLAAWASKAGASASTGTFAEAASFGDVLVLAVKGTAASDVLSLAGDGVNGKLVLDTTNPIAEAPPVDGVLSYFTGPNESLMERLQKQAPGAKLVKAFSCVGNAVMVKPDYGGTRPTMFVAGDDDAAKSEAKTLLAAFGWDIEDCGKAAGARAIEPLCMLWCIPGFRENRWSHAYAVLKK